MLPVAVGTNTLIEACLKEKKNQFATFCYSFWLTLWVYTTQSSGEDALLLFIIFLPTSWWLGALKITEKTIQENAFEQKKKKPGLNLTLG